MFLFDLNEKVVLTPLKYGSYKMDLTTIIPDNIIADFGMISWSLSCPCNIGGKFKVPSSRRRPISQFQPT